MIDVEKLIKQNSELMALLKIIHSFQLNDCWLCAGTIRNYIWDYLSLLQTLPFVLSRQVLEELPLPL